MGTTLISLEPDGKDSEGWTWVHWVVHHKWPVQCANLMNSTLLVTAIHAFKVLPRPSFLQGKKWLKTAVSGSARWKRLRGSDMAPLDSPWNVARPHELIPSSYWGSCNQSLTYDLPRSREKWLKMAVFAWLRVKWKSYGVPMVYNDLLSQALSNGENRITSFLLVASIHGSVRFGAFMHKRWEKWLKMVSFSMGWSQMEELGCQNWTRF